MNTEVNLCLKEVLDLEEKMEEEEDLRLKVIVVIWVWGAVVVMGGCLTIKRGKLWPLGVYINIAQPKSRVRGTERWRLVHW